MKKLMIVIGLISMVSCKQTDTEMELAKQEVLDSIQVAQEKQRVIDSMELVAARQKEVIYVDNTQAAPERKGMSNAAKGALIGAGVGAATGAIVSDKKGTGAIIGGLAGAGVGAGTGAIIDEKKKKE
ncbi:MAG: glycine zipper family protein [Flavobacterium sp.]|uniref:YMGG-like glycine zipper-containing protein n=1 Tax=unclassified Flavobacterium TaxID=196869 RepID=UPI000C368271|nr:MULTISPECIES: YMGG-like glycine zipper-containing protein [unclassified Flavobacterium]MBF03311.1 glycine zipper family protein [Flavobacterium sp.]MCO6161256.1 glycine zipper family protein [Flavobacterium sp. NRK F7]